MPPPVPCTSFYSRSDGIVAWQSCLDDEGPQSENVEVVGSHCGMGHHPAVAARDRRPSGAARGRLEAARWRPSRLAVPCPCRSVNEESRMPNYAYDRLTVLDNSFLLAETSKSHMHIAGTARLRGGSARQARRRHRHRPHPRLRRVAPAPDPALPPGARLHADRGAPGVGGRSALQHRLPRAPHQPAAARRLAPAEAALRPHHVAAARSLEAALGDVGRRGARGRRALRDDHQGPPLHDRRHVERRPAGGAAHARAQPRRSSRSAALAAAPGAELVAAPRRRGGPPREHSLRRRVRVPSRRRAGRAGSALRPARHAGARCATWCARACARCPTRRSTGRSAPHRRFDWLRDGRRRREGGEERASAAR